MGIALKQFATPVVAPSATSKQISLSGVSAGSLLVLGVTSTSATGPSLITESLSETVNAAVPWGGPSGASAGLYHVQNTAGGSVTFTVQFPASAQISLFLAEYTGAATSGVLDKNTNIVTGTNTGPNSGPLTPAQPGELAVVIECDGTVNSWSNGFVQEGTATGSPHATYADQVLSGTSPITAAATLATSVTWTIGQALFLPAGAPPAPIYATRRIYLPPGPGRFAGKAPGFGVGPFTTFLVRDARRAVPTRVPWEANPTTVTTGRGSLNTITGFAATAADDTSLAGALTTAIQLLGAAQDISTAAGQLNTQIVLAGAIQTVTTATAALTTAIQFASAATATATGSGTLSGSSNQLSGAAADDTNGAGQLTTLIQLVSAAIDVTAAAGNLATQILPAASALSITDLMGTLQTGVPIAGGGSDTTASAAVLQTGMNLLGAANAVITGAAGLSTSIQAAATASDTSSGYGQLKTGVILTQAVTTVSSAIGQLSTLIQMLAGAQASSTGSAGLVVQTRFTGAAVDTDAASGSITTAKNLAGAATEDTNLTAAATVGAKLGGNAQDASTGAAGLTTFLDPEANATATTVATGALGVAGTLYYYADAVLYAPPEDQWPPEGLLPFGMRYQRVGEMLIYAIDWSQWLARRWMPRQPVVAGDVVRPVRRADAQYLCVVPGTTGSREPQWPDYQGSQVLDGQAVWQCEALDNSSLVATIQGLGTWSANAPVIAFANSKVANQVVTLVSVDTTNAIAGVDYDISCQIGTTDIRTKIGKFRLKIR